MKSITMIMNAIFLLLLWSDLSRAEYVLVGNLPQAQAEVSSETVSLSALTPQTSSLSTTSVQSYYVSSGPLYTTNPPNYSCVQACALVFGGSSSDYHCSTDSTTITYTGNYAIYGNAGCYTENETYLVGTNYNCGFNGCASAYVSASCYNMNYCWISTATLAPTPQPSTLQPTSNTVRSYSVSSGPLYSTNPPVYSCVQACAIVFGGSASNYHCSTSSSTITYTGYYAEYGLSTCMTESETYSVGTNYNCGVAGCAYSAYVQDSCNNVNYCWLSTTTPVPTAQPSPTYMPTNSVRSYSVSSGPLYSTNPPVYSCVQACAIVFGGSASNYHCSTSSSTITYTGYYAEYGLSACMTESETYSVGTNYNCGSTGCAYSAYVQDSCNNVNYCWISTAPTPQPSTAKPTSSSLSYYVNYGPPYSTNPPVYSCVQACALVFGGSSSNYQCSIDSSSITNTAYYAEYGLSTCITMTDTASVGTNFNCGSTGCAYSAYVKYNCYSRNYCFSQVSPSSNDDSSSNKQHGLSTSSILAIVFSILGAGIVAALAALVYWFYFKKTGDITTPLTSKC